MINFTNHPYDMWDERQKEEACSFYTIQVWGRGTLKDLACLNRLKVIYKIIKIICIKGNSL